MCVCMVLGTADLGAAGFDFLFSRGISCSIKKKHHNIQVTKLSETQQRLRSGKVKILVLQQGVDVEQRLG